MRETTGGNTGTAPASLPHHLLADPAARYHDLGPDWHARRGNRDKKIRNHLRGLTALEVTAEDICAALGITAGDIPSGGHAA